MPQLISSSPIANRTLAGSIFLKVFTALLLLTGATACTTPSETAPLPVKVVVVTMFEIALMRAIPRASFSYGKSAEIWTNVSPFPSPIMTCTTTVNLKFLAWLRGLAPRSLQLQLWLWA